MKIFTFINIFFVILFFSGCENQSKVKEASSQLFAMDTVMDLYVYGENADEVLKLSENEIRRIDNMLKRDNPKGEIYKLNEGIDSTVSSEVTELISSALSISERTEGAFDISIAPIMDLWGFYNQKYKLPKKEDIEKTLKTVDYKNINIQDNKILIKNGSKIDLGGIGKGFTSDRVLKILKENNIKSAMMSLGGNVQTLGLKKDGTKWKVGIKDPDNTSSIIGFIETEDAAIITSGGYQRYFEENGQKYHHIIDTKTGFPADSGIKSSTIISKSGTFADGLSTALFVIGLDKSIALWKNSNDFDFIIKTSDNKIYITEGIENDFKSNLEFTVVRK